MFSCIPGVVRFSYQSCQKWIIMQTIKCILDIIRLAEKEEKDLSCRHGWGSYWYSSLPCLYYYRENTGVPATEKLMFWHPFWFFLTNVFWEIWLGETLYWCSDYASVDLYIPSAQANKYDFVLLQLHLNLVKFFTVQDKLVLMSFVAYPVRFVWHILLNVSSDHEHSILAI